MRNPWQLYDDLIDLVPPGITVRDALLGTRAFVHTDVGTGVAMMYSGGPKEAVTTREVVGKDLRDVAALVKSWDLQAAALGAAALCAALNTPERLAPWPAVEKPGQTSTFDLHAERIPTKRVAAIGHFGGIDKHVAAGDFFVLERSPSGDDLPDPACEYLLADREEVYITGSSLVNKTLPRLLQLCAHARVVLVGPSTPFAPEVFAAQVAEIAGALVVDPAALRREVAFGGDMSASHSGFQQFNRIIEEQR